MIVFVISIFLDCVLKPQVPKISIKSEVITKAVELTISLYAVKH